MSEENPTTGDSGASITDRLVQYLSAGNEPEQPKEPPQAASQDAPASEAPATAEPKEQPQSDAPEQETQPQITTTDLAKVLGVDEDMLVLNEDGTVAFKAKVDGKELSPKLAELLKTHQIEGHAENRTRAVAEQEKALQARTQEADKAFQERLNNAEQLANLAAQELMNEYQSVDWKALDQHPDQGAVAALKLKFQERNANIQRALQGINAGKGQLEQQAKDRQADFVKQEAARLPTLIPEWKDAAVREKESQELIDWGRKQGYSDQQLRALDNSSALHVATVRKAMLFDRLQQSKSSVENRVRVAPKIVKPGQAEQSGPEQRLNDLRQTIQKTGGKQGSVAAYLKARGIA